ncbi:MAG: AI-2E family transporter [Chloroflexota bacterium]|nr:AI-2E family transporter [Lentimicrobium sp.]
MEQEKNVVLYNITLRMVLLAFLIAFLVIGKPILLPLSIAMLFSFLLLPISKKLEDWKFPRSLAIIISLVIAMLAVGGLLYFFYKQVLMFVNDWPELSKQLTAKIDSIYMYIGQRFHISKFEQQTWINERISSGGASAGQFVLSIFTATGSFIATVVLLPIFIFFMTYYRDKFRHFVFLVSKEEKAEHALDVAKKISTVSQKYIKGLFIDIVILSILNSVGFLIFGLEHAILFGVLAAFLNVIPYIGVTIGSILPITMALITHDGFSTAIGVAAVCFGVQFLDNNFITPNVIGGSVSINPFTAILALTTSAMIWGVVGMVIALPFMGMLKVAFDNIDSMKPIGYLIGEEANFSPDNSFSKRIFSLRRKIKKPESGKN